ncbi:MAG: hypothetical protein ACKO9S_00790 [Bacteroidota bacterium]
MKTLLLPLIYFILSLGLSLLLITLTHRFLEKKLKSLAGLDAGSMCFNILASGLLISMGLLMSEASRPMITVINYLSRSLDSLWFLKAGAYIALLFVLVILFSGIIIAGSVSFFNRMTGKMDEIEEIRKGNTGIALLLAALMVSMTLFLKSPVISLLEAIIPMPVNIY